VSLLRRHIPRSIRLVLQITIIASLVIVVDLMLQAWAHAMSQRLSVFVGLIVTNCIVLGRTEAFAMQNPPLPSLLDGLGHGLGYSAVLVAVGSVRELFGSGTLLGRAVLEDVGIHFQPLGFMILPASAFFLLALLVWALRAIGGADTEREATELATLQALRSRTRRRP
jgi:Na+-transporting NADH:ubiquinone oxidoreductase subunit D